MKASSFILDDVEEPLYDDGLFIHYTASIIEQMGGRGSGGGEGGARHLPGLGRQPPFRDVRRRGAGAARPGRTGFIVGAISNSHRSLDAFLEHFSLHGLIHSHVSSRNTAILKPHISIFEEALARAGAEAATSVMVGDSLKADVHGALAAGMRAVLLRRSGDVPADVPPRCR